MFRQKDAQPKIVYFSITDSIRIDWSRTSPPRDEQNRDAPSLEARTLTTMQHEFLSADPTLILFNRFKTGFFRMSSLILEDIYSQTEIVYQR